MMLLPSERIRFILWLERFIESNTALIRQMEKSGLVVQGLHHKLKQEAAGCIIVRNILTNTTTETLTGEVDKTE